MNPNGTRYKYVGRRGELVGKVITKLCDEDEDHILGVIPNCTWKFIIPIRDLIPLPLIRRRILK